jgi:hypothetical protein
MNQYATHTGNKQQQKKTDLISKRLARELIQSKRKNVKQKIYGSLAIIHTCGRVKKMNLKEENI